MARMQGHRLQPCQHRAAPTAPISSSANKPPCSPGTSVALPLPGQALPVPQGWAGPIAVPVSPAAGTALSPSTQISGAGSTARAGAAPWKLVLFGKCWYSPQQEQKLLLCGSGESPVPAGTEAALSWPCPACPGISEMVLLLLFIFPPFFQEALYKGGKNQQREREC